MTSGVVDGEICGEFNIVKCKIRAESLGQKNEVAFYCHSPIVDTHRVSDRLIFNCSEINEKKIADAIVAFAGVDRVEALGCLNSLIQEVEKQPWYLPADAVNGMWAGMRIPDEYTIRDGNVCSIMSDGKNTMFLPICMNPVIATAIGENIDNCEHWIQVSFLDTLGHARTEWLTLGEALGRGVVKLVDKGLNLVETNTRKLNLYISSCLKENANDMPFRIVTSKCGWKEGNSVFAFGTRGFTEGDTLDILPVRTTVRDGLKVSGELYEWIEAARPVISHSFLKLKMYAAAAAPLLRLLNAKSFIIDHSGESSTGKTMSNDFAISMFGDAELLRFNGDTTKTAAEYAAEFYTDLPLYLDETGTQQSEDVLKALIYMIGNEQGRNRGKKEGGLRDIGTWKTVALTTGERPITSQKSFSGQLVRVIEVRGGFPGVLPEVKNADEVRKTSYGHLAEPYFRKVFKYKNRLLTDFRAARLRYTTTDNVKVNRIAESFAAMLVAGTLLEDVFHELGLPTVDPYVIIDEFFAKSVSYDVMENYSTRALGVVFDWVKSRNASFDIEGVFYDRKYPPAEFIGWITEEYTDIIPSMLIEALEGVGFDSTRALSDWAEDGILKTGKGRKDLPVKHHGKTSRVFRFCNREVERILHTGAVEQEGNQR